VTSRFVLTDDRDVLACDMYHLNVQASKDCVQKTIKRLEDKIQGSVLKQILYAMHSSQVCCWMLSRKQHLAWMKQHCLHWQQICMWHRTCTSYCLFCICCVTAVLSKNVVDIHCGTGTAFCTLPAGHRQINAAASGCCPCLAWQRGRSATFLCG